MVLAVTGTTGKIGGATLDALVQYDVLPQGDIVVMTSSPLDGDKIKALRSKYANLKDVRQASYDDPAALEKALAGIDKLFLVSTPAVNLDFRDAPHGKGREGEHFNVLDAAVRAGVGHVVYTSLAFADDSGAGVMRAHLRTEARLKELAAQGKMTYTSIREGLYNESWPLYLGHFDVGKEKRKEIVVAGDGPISWTSIPNLGLATAMICATGPQDDSYRNRILYLSQSRTVTLHEIAKLVGVGLKVVSPEEYIRHYRDDAGMDEAFLEWWASTYPSVAARHCDQGAGSPLEAMLASKGRKPKSLQNTLDEMLSASKE